MSAVFECGVYNIQRMSLQAYTPRRVWSVVIDSWCGSSSKVYIDKINKENMMEGAIFEFCTLHYKHRQEKHCLHVWSPLPPDTQLDYCCSPHLIKWTLKRLAVLPRCRALIRLIAALLFILLNTKLNCKILFNTSGSSSFLSCWRCTQPAQKNGTNPKRCLWIERCSVIVIIVSRVICIYGFQKLTIPLWHVFFLWWLIIFRKSINGIYSN